MSSATNANSSSKLRTPWRIAIVLLWVGVAIALFFTFKSTRPQPDQQASTANSNEQPIVLNPREGSQPGALDEPWDPAGIEDFSLTEASGRKVTKQDLLGKPWAVCFIFIQCAGPCTRVTSAMRSELQDRLKDVDVRLVTITVDPKNDTPILLEQYAQHFGADRKKWWFLTGDQHEIYRLIHNSFKMPVQEVTGPDRKPGYQVIHTSNVLHVDAQGVVQGKYNSLVEADMIQLRKALKLETARIAAHPNQAAPAPVVAPRP